MMYPKTIKDLIDCFKKLPGIGEKTAERLALSLFALDDEVILNFSSSIKNLKSNIKRCKKCHNFTEGDLCSICLDESREKSVICVVEEPKNVVLFEKMGTYNGLYHVLDGLISPLDGINPEDINIKSLIDRIEKDKIKEVILAVRPTIEGETTALYISKLLNKTGVKITKIAHGIPLGADMEYIDALTLELALENRTEI
ncbi:MAG: recombination mediator RecR [Bacilli bacterium]|nr:recombination mediator RecR [Bacilli bacterium]